MKNKLEKKIFFNYVIYCIKTQSNLNKYKNIKI
jgi:hypothetical protein